LISIYFTQKLEKRLKVITEEEKMPVFEALHSALISSDEEGDVLPTRLLRVEIRGSFHFFSKF